jgi:hypothetical protein
VQIALDLEHLDVGQPSPVALAKYAVRPVADARQGRRNKVVLELQVAVLQGLQGVTSGEITAYRAPSI